MKLTVNSSLTLFALLIAASSSAAMAATERAVATADLKDAKGNAVGTAEFSPETGGAQVKVKVEHLPPGAHGIHIHEKGTCTPPDFKSAGGHLNPDGKHHGMKNPQGHHEGDIGNLSVDAKGNGSQTFHLKGVELSGTDPRSLLKSDGTSLVIHAKADDQKSDPAGNSGDRIACGVIQGASQ